MKLISLRMPGPDQMLASKCGEMGHFQCDCQYNGDKPSDNQVSRTDSSRFI